ncbi:phosphatase PAP2 family protein [Clostridium lundense]|uniref:phosphatase PAP2 family protein n=1 Tax=Clostridium lundense TaxID=319475 RepID=UPI000687315B|nr:phosphatase PAP2 family protein [Clostridium lundense]
MEKIKNNFNHLLSLISIPIINISYTLLNNNSRGTFNLTTELDRTTPFLKEFIIPYLAWYPYIFAILLYLCFTDLSSYYKTLVSINIGLVICYIIYFFFQTTVPRPDLYGTDLLTRLTSLVYKFDNPFNCFPSIHVLTCYLMIKGIHFEHNSNILSKIIVYSFSSVIILSTLFVKQHVVMDLISAVVLGELVFQFVDKIIWKSLFIPGTE